MASNHAPLTDEEKRHLKEHPTLDVLFAWAEVRKISSHPEVQQEIADRLDRVS